VLHVWAGSVCDVDTLQRAFGRLGPELAANTLVLITLCANLPELFSERAASRGARKWPILKGGKDAEHLRILAESDPCTAKLLA